MISILMPIYNGIEYIDYSVNSILNQTYTNWELIIGINGHEENSEVFYCAKKYENDKIKIIDFFNIKSKSETLNEMIKYTKYNFICLLDVDDIWLNTKLESQLLFLNNYDVIGTNCRYFGDSNNYPNIPLNDLKNVNMIDLNPIINSSCLIKKELCYWDSCYEGVEDYDLWLKLWKNKKKFYNVDTIQVLHRIHSTSAFNTKDNNNKLEELKKKYF